jgi:hypothetical protein
VTFPVNIVSLSRRYDGRKKDFILSLSRGFRSSFAAAPVGGFAAVFPDGSGFPGGGAVSRRFPAVSVFRDRERGAFFPAPPVESPPRFFNISSVG